MATTDTAVVQEFTIHVEDAALEDLRERLARTRLPGDIDNADWRYGTEQAYLRELIDYLLDGYDWREHEHAMNALPQFRTEIDGIPVHFLHVRGKGPSPTPLILTHGWPETFWDLHKLIGPLTDPAGHGGDAEDAFDVVVPSLPGYGFSTPLTKPGINVYETADLWLTLMRDVLGYERFGAAGGDWGAIVTSQLGHKHAEHLLGIVLHMQFPLSFAPGGDALGVPPGIEFEGGLPAASEYAAEEAGWHDRLMHFFGAESGYSALQSTKPQTIAYALNDSPAGLLAWLVEKRRAWADTRGDVESRFSKDDLCTSMLLYWVTQSYGTSARYYYELAHAPWTPSHDRFPVVEAPTACAVFPKGESLLMPRRWAERYYNLERWTVMPAGGHFAPMEEPEALVGELRAHFRNR